MIFPIANIPGDEADVPLDTYYILILQGGVLRRVSLATLRAFIETHVVL